MSTVQSCNNLLWTGLGQKLATTLIQPDCDIYHTDSIVGMLLIHHYRAAWEKRYLTLQKEMCGAADRWDTFQKTSEVDADHHTNIPHTPDADTGLTPFQDERRDIPYN